MHSQGKTFLFIFLLEDGIGNNIYLDDIIYDNLTQKWTATALI